MVPVVVGVLVAVGHPLVAMFVPVVGMRLGLVGMFVLMLVLAVAAHSDLPPCVDWI
jgi:hypothetical protein